MEKFNVLYIHGYNGSRNGSTAQMLKKHLPDQFTFFSIDYDETDADHALEQINAFIRDNSIDVVVGSSLGAFLTLSANCMCRVVYNPCYLPSVELPKIECEPHIADTFKKYEKNWSVSQQDSLCTRAIFTQNDELLGDKYMELFAQDWQSKTYVAPGPHKMSEENLLNFVIPAISEVLDERQKL